MSSYISLVLFFLFGTLAMANVEFPKKNIRIGNKTIVVEVAETNKQRQQGLMNRTSLKPSGGMLFVFEREKPLQFWMKNTFIPLSIGFFDGKRVLVDIQDMEPVTSTMQKKIPRYQSKKPAKYALEVKLGWFVKNGIKIGQKFEFIKSK